MTYITQTVTNIRNKNTETRFLIFFGFSVYGLCLVCNFGFAGFSPFVIKAFKSLGTRCSRHFTVNCEIRCQTLTLHT